MWVYRLGKNEREKNSHSGWGRHLGTYQGGHPLEEVDALAIIDVVCLPTLRGTNKEGDSQIKRGTPLSHGPMQPLNPLVLQSSH